MTAIALNAVTSTASAIAACRSDWRRNFWKRWSAVFRVRAARSFLFRGCRRMTGLLPVIAAAEAARDDGDAAAFEELALRIAGAVSGSLNESKTRPPAPGVRDERRISVVLRYIEVTRRWAIVDRGTGARCRDESLSLLAHFPRAGRNDAASIHSAHADETCGGFLAANARKHFGDRFHRRFRRPVHLQPPLPANFRIEPERVSSAVAIRFMRQTTPRSLQIIVDHLAEAERQVCNNVRRRDDFEHR